MLTRADIVAALAKTPEMITVNVPEWGGEVFVRLLSESEAESLAKDTKAARSRFAVLAVCDEAGERLFTDEDTTTLADTSGAFAALDKIWEAGAKFNGLLDEGPAKN